MICKCENFHRSSKITMPTKVVCAELGKEITALEAEKYPDPYAMTYTCPHCGTKMRYNRRSVSGKSPYFSGHHDQHCLYGRLVEVTDSEADYIYKNLDLRYFLEPAKVNTSNRSAGGANAEGGSPRPRITLKKSYAILKSSPPGAVFGAQRKHVFELLRDARAVAYGDLDPSLLHTTMIELTAVKPREKDEHTLALKLYDVADDNGTQYILDFRPTFFSGQNSGPMAQRFMAVQESKAKQLGHDIREKFFGLLGKYGDKKSVIVVCSGQWKYIKDKNVWVTHIHSQRQVCIF